MLNAALKDEVEALTSIYDSDVLTVTSDSSAILALPTIAYSFTVQFPSDYPDVPPEVTGTHHIDASAKKGEGDGATSILQSVLGRVFVPGQVCLFDLIEEATPVLQQHHEAQNGTSQDSEEYGSSGRSDTPMSSVAPTAGRAQLTATANMPPPNWVMSEPLVVNKSTFVARCLPVTSVSEATSSLSHLMSTNKKVAAATHNITAWRIKTMPTNTAPEIVVQDCDDDGETAAGGRLLHLMQLTEVWNVIVIVTRWYGGVKLGADRFKCINNVAREALVNGDFIKEGKDSKAPSKRGKR
ncbi:hypothetical protein LTR05_002301 [Lithohypha guttulata]|uniref:RWD domain-containing protein n=1 Tax=Lithohypha guttulata TaxID=1690604 RepID=A0AAN7T2C1_9EURO|nr:hypothetical protein LTR05_002301 [Lithohypha guttulata]